MNMEPNRSLPYQPFLFTLFIGISIYFPNRSYFPVDVMILPMGILFILIAMALIISKYAKVDLNKSQILISCALILNYTYYNFREGEVSLNIWPNLAPATTIYILLFILLMAGIWKITPLQARKMSHILSIIAIAVVLISLANFGYFVLSEAHDASSAEQEQEFEAQFQKYLTKNLTSVLNNRDFYFIILDRYPGEDTLYAEYGFNNSEFYKNLSAMGFTVLTGSKSNYGQTYDSLPSMLNMDHITSVQDAGYNEENNRLWMFFKSQGFKFIYLPSCWWTTVRNDNADIILNPFFMPLRGRGLIFVFQKIMFFERSFLGNAYYNTRLNLFNETLPSQWMQKTCRYKDSRNR